MPEPALPTHEEAMRCLDARCRSKRGERVTAEESALCQRLCEECPEWYTATEARVFNETVPFGSTVRKTVPPLAYCCKEAPDA